MDDNLDLKVCGIVMPISTIDGCLESHWVEVKSIISDAISAAGFEANLVSDADEIGVIQKRIIQNLYDNPVVVCDVSAKNPNVMFELGLRLAFDKPTIIIKDDRTSYSFDTSSIEHLEYPRDLRYSKIVEFKARFAAKIKATYEASLDGDSYTTFLKHFGEFKVAKIDKTEVSSSEYIIEELRSLKKSLSKLEVSNTATLSGGRVYGRNKLSNSIKSYVPVESQKVAMDVAKYFADDSRLSVIPVTAGDGIYGLNLELRDLNLDIVTLSNEVRLIAEAHS